MVTVVLLFFNIGSAQRTNNFNLDTIIELPDYEITHFNHDYNYHARACGDSLIVLRVAGSCLYLTFIDILTYETYTSKIKLPGSTELKKTEKILDFFYNRTANNLTILAFYNVTVISLEKNKILHTFSNSYHAKMLHENNGMYYLSFFYDYHPLDQKHKAGLLKYSMDGVLIDSLFISPKFISLTRYGPLKPISFGDSIISVLSFDGYKILHYNIDFELIDSTKRLLEEWVHPNTELFAQINPLNINMFYGDLDAENFNRISKLELLQWKNNCFFVRYYKYDSSFKYSFRYLDVYSYHQNVLSLDTSFKESQTPFNAKISIDSSGFPLLSESCNTIYLEDGILQLKIDLAIKNINEISYSEFHKEKQRLLESEEPKLTFWRYFYR